MSSSLSTTLPHVLQEYDPSYEEKTKIRTTDGRQKQVREKGTCSESTEKGVNKSSEKTTSKSPEKTASKNADNPPAPPAREATSDFKKRQEKQHNERMYAAWEQVKEDVRESEIERLSQKITLQHELHRAQELQHEQHEEQRRQRQLKKREKEKAERSAKIEELEQVCRESLKDDRRIAKEKKAAESQEKLRKQSEVPPGGLLEVPPRDDVPLRDAAAPHLEAETPLQNATTDHGDVETEDPRVSLVSAPLSFPGLSPEESGFETLVEESEEEEEECTEESSLPWHHLQLYQLYGKDADYFLHPKIETEQKADILLNPRLKAIGGRAGAGTLWDVLRNESRMRLVRQDSKLLSPELKSAFGAFAREGLSNHKKPVKRNFFSSEDVPDLERLMDQSRIHEAQDFRHKVELMFRSSTINQDRTKVLLYNNPPPDLNNTEGEDGVGRYMPSWEGTQDVESELSYKKWLRRHDDSEEPLSSTGVPNYRGDRSSAGGDFSASISPRESMSGERPRAPRQPDHKKYVFLTEDKARTPGQFSKRHKEQEEAKHRPTAYGDHLPDIRLHKSLSAMANLGGDGSTSPSSDGSKPRTQRARSEMSSKFISQWEPLSLNALLEYRDNQTVLGQGKFNQGKTPVWTSTASVSAR